MNDKSTWTDDRIRTFSGNLLRAGVLAAALLVAVGGVIYLARHGAEPADWSSFHNVRADLKTIPGIVWNAELLHGRGLIQLGLLLLIATPVAQVALSVAGFAGQRDRRYVVIGLIVLGFLLCSMIGAGRI
jgi:uncharacterized membrane protein